MIYKNHSFTKSTIGWRVPSYVKKKNVIMPTAIGIWFGNSLTLRLPTGGQKLDGEIFINVIPDLFQVIIINIQFSHCNIMRNRLWACYGAPHSKNWVCHILPTRTGMPRHLKTQKGTGPWVPARTVRYMSRVEVKDLADNYCPLVLECIENFDKRDQNNCEGVSFAKMYHLIWTPQGQLPW